MKVDIACTNSSFLSLIEKQDQIVFLDANFFIPPDRSSFNGIKPYRFDRYKEIWLEPLLAEFNGVSIHESVFDELVSIDIKTFADENANSNPKRLRVFHNSELSTNEKALMLTYIDKLAVHSQYDPDKDNAKDRGEVLSLSYMAAKNYLYFAANDDLPIRLIKDADKLNTGLDDMGVIQMYELIYFLHKTNKYDSKSLRQLYKYQYHLTDREKRQNPEWGNFIQLMDELYGEQISKSLCISTT